MSQKTHPPRLFLFVYLFLLTACAPSAATQPPAVMTRDEVETALPSAISPTPTPLPREIITLPISIYIVDNDSGNLASDRNVDELTPVFEKANDIWGQADIFIEVATIQRLTLPDEIVQGIARGDFRPFFNGLDYDLTIPEPSLLNGFYASSIGGANGIVPFGVDLFFVTDEPSVHDERVSSHEIGHILGLHHTCTDPDRLMFSGTNGMTLTYEEIIVARYAAQGLLDRLR